jgi:nicotinamide-nucleotide amidase
MQEKPVTPEHDRHMSIIDDKAYRLAAEVGQELKRRGQLLATAESCTGGLVSMLLTTVAGSSAWFDRGFVSYSNAAKQDMLGVRPDTLARYGAVSEQTAGEMARGAIDGSLARVAVSITGIAGPGGGSPDKPIGTVCIGWCVDDNCTTTTCHFEGERDSVREQSAMVALQGLLVRMCG